ncbi:flagellar filament capping protein FliD [Catenuloplanes atrovinosus]|uniref:Flagellar hook-associated protein 2 n=1 Tax=Catenuloplanes atrovinosus TaxID=137266 RepID=A0AAE3YXP3_9ACTN|nr:flagellar filament capping protein FliD [Catenuloplanes atrovinosus]MDR7280495.1 flagellar hook-associated protein 2 [Catenuloplanes atrovinosus]
MTTSVSGLVSGMDTNSLVTQLMQVEAVGQTRLKSKVSTEEKAVTAYQSVNTKLAAIETAADELGKLATWRSAKATSSSSTVTATTASANTTQTGTVTFDVISLAKAQVSTTRAVSTGDATSHSSLTITKGDGTQSSVDISADRSLAGIASAINGAGLGIKATVVALEGGESVLQLSSTKAGVANGFTIDGGFDTEVKTPTAATDAKLQVGGADADGGYAVTSTSNTFGNLITGTSITVTKEGETGVRVDVASDTSAITAKVKSMVDAMNGAFSEINKQTAYNTSASKSSAAALTGDFSVRQISQKLLGTVSGGLDGFGSLSKLGISLTRDGTVSFDETKFKATYEADPDAIKTATTSYATKVKELSDASQNGVTDVINGRKSLIDNMNDQISGWDVRLAARKLALTRQFSAMETSLSSLNNQSSWLSGQLASL